MFLAKSYCDIGNSQSSSSTVAPDGEITTTFEYDGIQRLVRVTDTEGNVTTSVYDMGDRRTESHTICLFRRLPPI